MKQSKKQQELEERYRKLDKEHKRLMHLRGYLLGGEEIPIEDVCEPEEVQEIRDIQAKRFKENKDKYGTATARIDENIEKYLSEHPKISEAEIIWLEKKNAQYKYEILSWYQTPSLQNEQLILLQKLMGVDDEYSIVSDFGEVSLPPDIDPEELNQLYAKYAENVEKYGSWEIYMKQRTNWKSDYVLKSLRNLKIKAKLTAFVEPNTYEQQLINLVIQLDKICKEHIKETFLHQPWSEKFDKGSQSGDYNIDILCELWNKIQDVGEQLITRNDLKNYSDNPFNRCANTIKNEKTVNKDPELELLLTGFANLNLALEKPKGRKKAKGRRYIGGEFELRALYADYILKKLGLPATMANSKLVYFDTLPPTDADIETKIDQLKLRATEYLSSDAKTEIQILKEAQDLNEEAYDVLKKLKIPTHVYTTFIYDEILLKNQDSLENILAELRLVNTCQTILDAVGRIGVLCEFNKYNLNNTEIAAVIHYYTKEIEIYSLKYLPQYLKYLCLKTTTATTN
ncbi:hypothetical protein AGMMS49982_13200 [Bacteroidia bacterium]|nr:hypothetical protein AGMMS49982_13200 [Bacteroidia bacterium]